MVSYCVVKSNGDWVPDDPTSRIDCCNVLENLLFLVKQFEGYKDLEPTEALDQTNWIWVLKSIDAASKISTRSYSSWDAEMLKAFKDIQHNLRLGLKIVKKYKPEFNYDLEGKVRM